MAYLGKMKTVAVHEDDKSVVASASESFDSMVSDVTVEVEAVSAV